MLCIFLILAFPIIYFNLFLCKVDWGIKGSFVAVARKNILSILSAEFEERVSIPLPFKSWIGDSEANVSVKGLHSVFHFAYIYYVYMGD